MLANEDHVLNEEQITELKDAFDMFAEDGDLSIKKLGLVLQSLGQTWTRQELHFIVNEIDLDCDGKISFDEFLRMVKRNMARASTAHDLQETFHAFDEDGDGYISMAELRGLLAKLGQSLAVEEVEEMLRVADADGDGFVSYKDFIQLVTSKRRSSGKRVG